MGKRLSVVRFADYIARGYDVITTDKSVKVIGRSGRPLGWVSVDQYQQAVERYAPQASITKDWGQPRTKADRFVYNLAKQTGKYLVRNTPKGRVVKVESVPLKPANRVRKYSRVLDVSIGHARRRVRIDFHVLTGNDYNVLRKNLQSGKGLRLALPESAMKKIKEGKDNIEVLIKPGKAKELFSKKQGVEVRVHRSHSGSK